MGLHGMDVASYELRKLMGEGALVDRALFIESRDDSP